VRGSLRYGGEYCLGARLVDITKVRLELCMEDWDYNTKSIVIDRGRSSRQKRDKSKIEFQA
jgi:hypothetical protein